MPVRLLVVDDDAATLLGLSEALRSRLPDLEIQTASSAERALILMALERFAIILTDVRMPGMDGVAFLKEIKSLSPDTLVILMSGCAAERREEAMRLGAWSFVEKPFAIDDLVTSLRRAIRDSDMVHQLRDSNKRSVVSEAFKTAS
jgi:two-component system, NtrC family, C4-dicarboxylate transport response regulator DctD